MSTASLVKSSTIVRHLHGFSDAAFYGWRAKFGGLQVDDAKRLKLCGTTP
jgi:hypothetical protein